MKNINFKIILKRVKIAAFIIVIIMFIIIFIAQEIAAYRDNKNSGTPSFMININAPEWINLQKQISKEYPKIKKVELYGDHTLGIGYITDGKISEDDAEKIFEETREVILKPNIYEILQKKSAEQNTNFRTISIGFEYMKSDGDTVDYADFDSSPQDNTNTKYYRKNDSQSHESEITSYRYAFTTWEITYNDKTYEKYILVK